MIEVFGVSAWKWFFYWQSGDPSIPLSPTLNPSWDHGGHMVSIISSCSETNHLQNTEECEHWDRNAERFLCVLFKTAVALRF